MAITIRGMGWNHERCMAPLRASGTTFAASHPAAAGLDVQFTWDTRSLSDFGDGHLEELIDQYDLIVYDHPFVGQAEREGLFLNLAPHLTETEKAAFKADSLGPSWASYWTEGGLWALPIDAAAQVATYQPQAFDKLGFDLPQTVDDVLRLAEAARAQGHRIALPLVAIDAICLYFTLTAALGDPVPRDGENFPADATSRTVLDLMVRLRDAVDPRSLNWNPIQCFDYMSTHDDIIYQPFAFGYTNYARPDGPAKHKLKFANIPAAGANGCAGAIIGGAGVGITRACAHRDLMLEYIKWVCSPAYQAGEYTTSGGQPASLSAWQSPEANAVTGDFFADTLPTLQQAYLRPTFNGIIPWFRAAGHLLVDFLKDQVTADDCIEHLRASFLTARIK